MPQLFLFSRDINTKFVFQNAGGEVASGFERNERIQEAKNLLGEDVNAFKENLYKIFDKEDLSKQSYTKDELLKAVSDEVITDLAHSENALRKLNGINANNTVKVHTFLKEFWGEAKYKIDGKESFDLKDYLVAVMRKLVVKKELGGLKIEADREYTHSFAKQSLQDTAKYLAEKYDEDLDTYKQIDALTAEAIGKAAAKASSLFSSGEGAQQILEGMYVFFKENDAKIKNIDGYSKGASHFNNYERSSETYGMLQAAEEAGLVDLDCNFNDPNCANLHPSHILKFVGGKARNGDTNYHRLVNTSYPKMGRNGGTREQIRDNVNDFLNNTKEVSTDGETLPNFLNKFKDKDFLKDYFPDADERIVHVGNVHMLFGQEMMEFPPSYFETMEVKDVRVEKLEDGLRIHGRAKNWCKGNAFYFDVDAPTDPDLQINPVDKRNRDDIKQTQTERAAQGEFDKQVAQNRIETDGEDLNDAEFEVKMNDMLAGLTEFKDAQVSSRTMEKIQRQSLAIINAEINRGLSEGIFGTVKEAFVGIFKGSVGPISQKFAGMMETVAQENPDEFPAFDKDTFEQGFKENFETGMADAYDALDDAGELRTGRHFLRKTAKILKYAVAGVAVTAGLKALGVLSGASVLAGAGIFLGEFNKRKNVKEVYNMDREKQALATSGKSWRETVDNYYRSGINTQSLDEIIQANYPDADKHRVAELKAQAILQYAQQLSDDDFATTNNPDIKVLDNASGLPKVHKNARKAAKSLFKSDRLNAKYARKREKVKWVERKGSKANKKLADLFKDIQKWIEKGKVDAFDPQIATLLADPSYENLLALEGLDNAGKLDGKDGKISRRIGRVKKLFMKVGGENVGGEFVNGKKNPEAFRPAEVDGVDYSDAELAAQGLDYDLLEGHERALVDIWLEMNRQLQYFNGKMHNGKFLLFRTQGGKRRRFHKLILEGNNLLRGKQFNQLQNHISDLRTEMQRITEKETKTNFDEQGFIDQFFLKKNVEVKFDGGELVFTTKKGKKYNVPMTIDGKVDYDAMDTRQERKALKNKGEKRITKGKVKRIRQYNDQIENLFAIHAPLRVTTPTLSTIFTAIEGGKTENAFIAAGNDVNVLFAQLVEENPNGWKDILAKVPRSGWPKMHEMIRSHIDDGLEPQVPAEAEFGKWLNDLDVRMERWTDIRMHQMVMRQLAGDVQSANSFEGLGADADGTKRVEKLTQSNDAFEVYTRLHKYTKGFEGNNDSGTQSYEGFVKNMERGLGLPVYDGTWYTDNFLKPFFEAWNSTEQSAEGNAQKIQELIKNLQARVRANAGDVNNETVLFYNALLGNSKARETLTYKNMDNSLSVEDINAIDWANVNWYSENFGTSLKEFGLDADGNKKTVLSGTEKAEFYKLLTENKVYSKQADEKEIPVTTLTAIAGSMMRHLGISNVNGESFEKSIAESLTYVNNEDLKKQIPYMDNLATGDQSTILRAIEGNVEGRQQIEKGVEGAYKFRLKLETEERKNGVMGTRTREVDVYLLENTTDLVSSIQTATVEDTFVENPDVLQGDIYAVGVDTGDVVVTPSMVEGVKEITKTTEVLDRIDFVWSGRPTTELKKELFENLPEEVFNNLIDALNGNGSLVLEEIGEGIFKIALDIPNGQLLIGPSSGFTSTMFTELAKRPEAIYKLLEQTFFVPDGVDVLNTLKETGIASVGTRLLGGAIPDLKFKKKSKEEVADVAEDVAEDAADSGTVTEPLTKKQQRQAKRAAKKTERKAKRASRKAARKARKEK